MLKNIEKLTTKIGFNNRTNLAKQLFYQEIQPQRKTLKLVTVRRKVYNLPYNMEGNNSSNKLYT